MAQDENRTLTGTLRFRDMDFTFVFANEELKLIPPKGKHREVITSSIWNDEFGSNKELDGDCLYGRCYETSQRIIFIPDKGAWISKYNSILTVPLSAYIIVEMESLSRICGMAFLCPELNYIYPVKKAFRDFFATNTSDDANNGVLTVSTLPSSETTTVKEHFSVGRKEVNTWFTYLLSFTTNNNVSPLSVQSTLKYSFAETDDISFIMMLLRITRAFICYLCYRKSVSIPSVMLYSTDKNGNSIAFATLYSIEDNGYKDSACDDVLERCIKYDQITGCIGKILTSITEGSLYYKHLPRTFEDGQSNDAARFVLTAAAFDWEFKKLFSKKIKQLQQQNDDKADTEHRSSKKTRLCLKEKVVYALEDLSSVIDGFGINLCMLNNDPYSHEQIAEAFKKQRNAYAHGDLDMEFIGYSLVAVILMRYVVYAMQLKRFGVEDEKIKQTIIDLFGLSIRL